MCGRHNFYRRQSRYDDAGRALESAVALVPRRGPLNAALATPLAYTGRYDEALAAAEKAFVHCADAARRSWRKQ